MRSLLISGGFAAVGLDLCYRYGRDKQTIINIGTTLKDVKVTNMIFFDKVSYWIDMDPENYSPMFKRTIYSLSRIRVGNKEYNVWDDLYKGTFRL